MIRYSRLPRLLVIATLLLALLWVAGCAQMAKVPLPRIGGQTPLIQLIPERTGVAAKDLAPDVKLTLAALLHQLYMEPALPREVKFSRAGRHQLYDPNFDYSGFFIKHIDISVHENLGTDQFRLGGVFHFEDGLSRRTSVIYQARYRITRNELVIEESSVHPLQPTFPRVEAYFVPEKAYTDIKPGSLDSFMSWYLFALANAEAMAPTAAERTIKNDWDRLTLINKMKSGRQVPTKRYVIMVFAMDRILDDGFLLINLSHQRTGCPAASHEKLKTLDDNGWKIGLLGAELALDDWTNEIFVNVGYGPERGLNFLSGYPVLIGSFATTKNYGERIEASNNPGPLEQGRLFLNPKQRDDARLIQQRLADSGFYRMDVDGLFGPGSLAALQAFKKNNGLGDNPQWDINTQKTLFSGSGL